MDIQKKIIKWMLLLTVAGLIIYSEIHFVLQGKEIKSFLVWGSQIAISICTSALVTGMVAFVSERQMKRNYYHLLGQEFSRLFNCVDDYLRILELNDIYFEEYYSFRKEFLSFVLMPEKEGISVKRKKLKLFEEALMTLYIKPINLLYYSYIQLKKLEKDYLQEKGRESYKVRMQYKKRLDFELKELNSYLLQLKEENKYNVVATQFYKMAGTNKGKNIRMDDCESGYKDKFYTKE